VPFIMKVCKNFYLSFLKDCTRMNGRLYPYEWKAAPDQFYSLVREAHLGKPECVNKGCKSVIR
jgi:hypothetical protein